jgi:hypothetical protein
LPDDRTVARPARLTARTYELVADSRTAGELSGVNAQALIRSGKGRPGRGSRARPSREQGSRDGDGRREETQGEVAQRQQGASKAAVDPSSIGRGRPCRNPSLGGCSRTMRSGDSNVPRRRKRRSRELIREYR